MADKNQDIIELIIQGQDEYSDISESVREELGQLTEKTKESRAELQKLDKALDLYDTYKKQESAVADLAEAQAKSKIKLDELSKSNKEAGGTNLELAASLAKAKAEFGSLRTATNRAQKEFDKTRSSIKAYGVDLVDVEKNQESMRSTAEGLAASLTELSKTQTAMVGTAKEQAAAAKEQRAAQEEAQKAAEKQAQLNAARIEAEKKAAEQERITRAEIERLTAEITDQVRALERGEISWEDYKRRVSDAGAASQLTGRQVATIKKSLDDQVLAAKASISVMKEQRAAQEKLKESVSRYSKEIQLLIEKYKSRKISAQEFELAEDRLREKLSLSRKEVAKTRIALGAYVQRIEQIPEAVDPAAKSVDKLTQVTRRLAQAYTVLVAAQKSADLAIGAGKSYAETETAMIGLQKTTSLTASEIAGLIKQLDDLSSNATPTTKAGLLEIAAAAGRMGVQGVDNIGAFVRAIDSLASAAELSGDETAQAIAQILNVTGEAQSNVIGVASAIATLGNNTATTEQDIIQFAKRLSSDTATVKLTSAEVLGLAASFAEMGLQSEGAGTVVGRTFRFIEEAVVGGGESLLELQRVTGKTGEEIQKAFGQDKVGLFTDFVAGIGRMQDGGETLNGILSDLGIKSDENARILGLLSVRYQNLNKNVELSNGAFERGNAHIAEAAKKSASLESAFAMLQNRAKALYAIIGEAFSDDLARSIDGLAVNSGELEEALASLGEAAADTVEMAGELLGVVLSIGDVLDTVGGDFNIFTGIMSAVGQSIDAVVFSVNGLIGGIAELGIRYNTFFGDTEAVEEWERVQTEAFERVDAALSRSGQRLKLTLGQSSRAFDDLKRAYDDNKDALSLVDEEQRKAAETIINSTGYIKGFDDVYRDLTASLRRAGKEQQIVTTLTASSNQDISEHVRLLQAQGLSLDEATAKASAKAKADKDAADAAVKAEREKSEEARKSGEVITATDKEIAKAAKEREKQVSQAAKNLGVDLSAIAEDLGGVEKKAISSFGVLLDEITGAGDAADISAKKIEQTFLAALGKISSEKGVTELIERLRLAGVGVEGFGAIWAKLAPEIVRRQSEIAQSNQKISSSAAEAGAGFVAMGSAAEDAADKSESGLSGAQGAAANLAAFYDGITARLAAMSPAAVNAFTAMQGGAASAGDDIGAAEDRIRALSESISRLGDNTGQGFTGITDWMRETSRSAQQVERDFLKQKIAVQQLIDAFDRGDYSAATFSRSVEGLDQQFNLLDQQDLSALRSAIESIQREADSLTDSLTDTVASLRQELASLKGDTAEVERLRNIEQRIELEKQLARAKELGDKAAISAAQEALALQQQAYSLRVAQAKQQQEDDRRQAAERATQTEQSRQEQERQQREQIKENSPVAQQTTTAPARTIVLQGPSGSAEVSATPEQEKDLLTLLEDLGYRSIG